MTKNAVLLWVISMLFHNKSHHVFNLGVTVMAFSGQVRIIRNQADR